MKFQSLLLNLSNRLLHKYFNEKETKIIEFSKNRRTDVMSKSSLKQKKPKLLSGIGKEVQDWSHEQREGKKTFSMLTPCFFPGFFFLLAFFQSPISLWASVDWLWTEVRESALTNQWALSELMLCIKLLFEKSYLYIYIFMMRNSQENEIHLLLHGIPTDCKLFGVKSWIKSLVCKLISALSSSYFITVTDCFLLL